MNTTHKLHIFDMDGTILDSMPMWATIASDYLTHMIFHMTMM